MAVQVAVGSFNIGTGGAGTTVSVITTDADGNTFQPKAIKFWWSGRSSVALTTSREDLKPGFGFAAGPTDRRAVYGQADNNVDGSAATRATDSAYRDDACIAILSTARANSGAADLASFNVDGFTLDIDQAFATNVIVEYKAVGGSDITAATTGQFQEPGATGTQAVTTTGVNPSVVWFAAASVGTAGTPEINPGMGLCFGCGVSATSRWVSAAGCRNATTTADASRYNRNTECIALFNMAASGPPTDARATISSLGTGQFTVNWIERNSSRWVHYLAIEGGEWVTGTIDTKVNTTPSSVTGLSGTPRGLLISTIDGATTGTDDAPTANAAICVGAAVSGTVRRFLGWSDRDAIGTSVSFTSYRDDAIVAQWNPGSASAPGYNGLMDLVSMDANGFTYVMDQIAVATACRYTVVMDGAAPPAGQVYASSYWIN